MAPDTVVLTVDGKPYTVKDMDELSNMMPPQFRSSMKQNPQGAMTQFFLIAHLAEEARAMKLDQESPTKEAVEGTVRQILANAVVAKKTNQFSVPPDEVESYYGAHKENFETAKISAIYLEFAINPKLGSSVKTEAEAKTKAEDLVKQLRAGGDFAALAKANSDDKSSAEKGGEYATIKKGDKYPEAIKTAVFKLNEGEISDPVRQNTGFYIFKTTSKSTQALPEVRESLFQQLKQEKFNKWIQDLQKQFSPKIEKPEYFQMVGGGTPISGGIPPGSRVAPPAPPPPQKKQ